jgi:chromosome segregation ATPase
MAFNINQYLDEIKKNIDEINSKYNKIIGKNTIINELKNDYENLKNEVKKPNNTHAAYNLIAVITFKLDSIHGILIGLEITKQTAATTELTTEITNANSALIKAQEGLKKQIDDKIAAEEAARKLETEINSLTENATNQQKTIEEFNDTLRKNDAELSRLKNDLKNRDDATAISQSELNEYKKQEDELLKQKAAIKSNINSYNESIKSKNRELEIKQEELNALTTNIEKATAKVDEKKQELMKTKAETALLMNEIKVVTENNFNLKKELEKKNEEYLELLKKTLKLGDNIAGLNEQINAAELLKEENDKKKKEAQDELDRINKEKEQAKTELTEINKQIAEAQATLNKLQAEISKLEEEKAGLESGITETEAKLELLQEQKDKLNAQNVELRDKQEILKEQNVILTSDNELLKGKIKENEKVNEELITKKRQEVDTQIAELEKALENKNNDLKNVENSISTKTTENKRLSLTNAALQTKINNDIKAYEDGLLAAELIIKETTDIIKGLQNETAMLKDEKETLIAKVESNKKQIKISKNVIVDLENQQTALQTTNTDLLLKQSELEESNNAANKELFNTLIDIGANKGIIEGQLILIREQEKIITKQKLQIDKLNKEIKELEESRDGLIKLLDTKSEELIKAQEELNEIQGNLATKENELAAKNEELKNIERREKTLSENEANLLQRTENVEEREKIQADKDSLLAEINKLNEENNTLQEDKDNMLATLNRDKNSIDDLNKQVKDYNKLLQEKQNDFERSIAELEKQQLVEAKMEFEVLLKKVDTMKAEYDKNVKEKTWVKYLASKITILDQGWNAYIESIGTLIDVSKENKYFKYLKANVINGYDNEDDKDNINRYSEYEKIHKNPPPKIPLPQEEEQSTQEQSIDELLPPSPSPRTDLPQVNHGEIPQISDTEKIDLIQTYVNNPPKNIGDNLLLELYSYAYNNMNVDKMQQFINKTENQVISICKTNIIHYIKTHHVSNSEYNYLFTNYLNTNKTNITDKIIRKSLAEISGSTQNKLDYEEFMTHTASRILLHYVNVSGGNKTKRNTTYNKKTRRTHK